MKRLLTFFLLIVVSTVVVSAQQRTVEATTLEGQLVCSECWFEADRKTTPYGDDADIQCARECSEKGIPTAIAVKGADGHKLYVIEDGKLTVRGPSWLDTIGKQVRLKGKIRSKDNKHYVSVDTLEVTGPNPVQAARPSVVGTEVDLTLKDLFGKDQKTSEYRGRILVLNFWATWCVPCRTEMPDLTAVQNEYAAFGVQVVGASADAITDRDKVVKFVRDVKVNFPVWLGLSTDDMKRFGVGPALPATVVIGRDGKILETFPGVIKAADLKKTLDKLVTTAEKEAKKEIASNKPATRSVSTVPS